MQPPYDAAFREAVRLRMSPPNRESVAEIARDTGITAQTIYNWRSQWQKQGQLVPATNRPPEQWSAADKLAAVIEAAGLNGTELGTFCRERGGSFLPYSTDRFNKNPPSIGARVNV